MTTDNPPPVARTALWVKLALCLSLALNLLVVGFVAGSVLRNGGAGPNGARAPALGTIGVPYILALPREDRREMFRNLRRNGGEALPDRRMRRAMFDAVLVALREEPFDPEKIEAAARRQAHVSIAVQQRVQKAWIETISAMSEDERQAYADAVELSLREMSRKR